MTASIPNAHPSPVSWSDVSATRFASNIKTDSSEGCQIGLLGLADDTGVALNNGRVGARNGPRAFREALLRFGTSWCTLGDGIDLSSIGVFDAGDIQPGRSIDDTHAAVTESVAALLDLELVPICIGGGHDLTWPAVRALAERFSSLAGVYFDAHLDVRETVGSGMPFRKILAETSCHDLHVVGLEPFANAREHVKWFQSKGGEIHDTTRGIGTTAERLFVSFDLDVIDAAHAPGVSATNPVGMDSATAARYCLDMGHDARVCYFDIMEHNPAYDIDGRTARLAVSLFLHFIAGFAQRAT